MFTQKDEERLAELEANSDRSEAEEKERARLVEKRDKSEDTESKGA